MRTLRLFIVLALAGALPGCSALFDGSRFLGGDGDGGVSDGGGDPDDGGTDGGGTDGGTDAGVDPCLDVSCEADEYCDEGDCVACDDDDDGFAAEACDPPGGLFDCNDGNPSIHPGALPICGNGIDESCGLMAPIGLPTDELGFFPVRSLTPPPAESDSPPMGILDLKQVRVAALSADRAAVFFQTRPGRAMIWYGNVRLGDTSGDPPELLRYSDLDVLPPLTSSVRLSYDMGRDDADRVHLLTMIEDFTARGSLAGTPPWIRTHDTSFDSAGVFTPGGGTTLRPESAGYGAFNVTGQPAVIRNPGGFVLGVPANYNAGGVLTDGLVSLEVGTGLLNVLGGTSPVVGTTPGWAVSNGRAAVFPGAGGTYIAWDGRLDPGGPTETRQFTPGGGGSVGRPVILSSNEAGNRVLRVLEPRADEIVVYRLTCPDSSPLASCAFDVTAPLRIPIDLGTMDPLMTSFTGDEMGFHFAYVAREGTMPRVRYVQYRYADGMLADLPLPTPGNARIVDLDIDGTFVPDPAEGADAGRALLTFAYARRNGANEPTVFVGGVLACVGYGSD